MIALCVAQALISRPFLGGTGQDLANFYRSVAKRSVVCSERVVQFYGPCRFSIDESKRISPVDSLVRVRHNPLREKPVLDIIGDSPPASYPDVDALVSSVLPLNLIGILLLDPGKEREDQFLNPATLTFVKSKGINGSINARGSDVFSNLNNKGISKPVNFPKFFGKFWFSCSLVNCSEIDFLTALAQTVDSRLDVTTSSYAFVPNVESIRARFLKTYQMFGDASSTFSGLRQRVLYKAYESAPPDVIQGTISDEKMDKVFRVTNNPELKASLEEFVKAAVKEFSSAKDPVTREIAKNVKEGAEIKIAYGYAFRFSPVVMLNDGRSWRF